MFNPYVVTVVGLSSYLTKKKVYDVIHNLRKAVVVVVARSKHDVD